MARALATTDYHVSVSQFALVDMTPGQKGSTAQIELLCQACHGGLRQSVGGRLTTPPCVRRGPGLGTPWQHRST